MAPLLLGDPREHGCHAGIGRCQPVKGERRRLLPAQQYRQQIGEGLRHIGRERMRRQRDGGTAT